MRIKGKLARKTARCGVERMGFVKERERPLDGAEGPKQGTKVVARCPLSLSSAPPRLHPTAYPLSNGTQGMKR